MFDINQEINKIPKKPGVYIMKDAYDNILYIGKASVLKNRVSQYFRENANMSPRITNMVSKVKKFEYIVTSSETEALVLECNLIKEHRPKYNVMLKDDKNYPYIKVTVNEEYPRVIITRKVLKDKAKYFGPFPDASAAKEMVTLLNKIFQLKICLRQISQGENTGRACLNYHINQCLAPCQGKISVEEYSNLIQEACEFLEGKQQNVVKRLEKEMTVASDSMEFEKAGILRDRINAAKKLLQKQFVEAGPNEFDIDVIGLARGVVDACVQIFFIRNGKLVRRENFMFKAINDVNDNEIISSFIKQFYSLVPQFPTKILLDSDIEEKEAIEKWLSERKGSKVEVKIPIKGDKRNLLEMARRNAEIELQRHGIGYETALKQIQELLQMARPIKRIEAFDISNLGGSSVVGAMVVFEGRLDKKQYKRYKIKTVIGQDDPGCINEVIGRRLRRGINPGNELNSERQNKLPDLILVDGGIAQLNSAQKAVKSNQLQIKCAGMSKDNRHKTKALVVSEGLSLELKKYPQAMKLISEIQEEVHRYVVDFHHKLRKKETIKSVLDEIEGIGATRKRELLRYFGSIERIKEASVEQLAKVSSMNAKVAEKVYSFFRK